MNREDLVIGKRYWVPSGYGKPMRKKLTSFSTTSDIIYFNGVIARLPEEVFETKKECQKAH